MSNPQQFERAADMLTAYGELIRRDGASRVEEHHYVPEVEAVAAELRALSGRTSRQIHAPELAEGEGAQPTPIEPTPSAVAHALRYFVQLGDDELCKTARLAADMLDGWVAQAPAAQEGQAPAPLTEDYLRKVEERINPKYRDIIGTLSHERALLLGEIRRLRSQVNIVTSERAAAREMLRHIRFHANRHDLDRTWLKAADDVLGTFRPARSDAVVTSEVHEALMAERDALSASQVASQAAAIDEFDAAKRGDR